MQDKDTKENAFIITHSLELLIWLIIVCLFVAFNSLGYILKEQNQDNDYKIFLQDVDGLIVGSPVRMMGIEVGYITKIKPMNDEVYVKFIITNPEVFIPRGTSATVEFTGMAGSKSLELYLPQNINDIDNSIPILQVTEPKRLHDAFDLLNQMYKKINSIIFSVSSFGNKVDLDFKDLSNSSGSNFNDFIKYSDGFIEESGKKIYSINSVIERLKHDK